GWHTVFALFGAVAPLFALLAQPHRGSRDGATSTTAVDIAGIAVMTGFLYSHFVVSPDLTPITAQRPSWALVMLSEFQQLMVVVGMAGGVFVARRSSWAPTYRRLAFGTLVNLIMLTISNAEIWQGLYRSGFVYDVIWIMPFAFYPWAASIAPRSEEAGDELEEATESRPWVVFGVLAFIPVLDYGLREALPLGPLDGFRGLFGSITIVSVLPLLMARLVVERDEAQNSKRRRRLLAAAIEHAEDLISIVSADGRMEHANSAFCRALGATPEDVTRRRASDFLAEESKTQSEAIADTVRRDGVWRGTLSRKRMDNSTFLSSSTVVSLTDDRGQLTHFVGVERDITPETQLRDQLIHSERLAAVGQLVSGVAHELNNPLQSIIGFSELMLEEERRQETRADLSQIRSEAERAAKIVRNLLSFVRRSAAERSVVGVNEIVRSTVALRLYELALANVEVEEQYTENLPPVDVNREEIQQVLLNLIMNAEQAMRAAHGRGRLRLRTSGSWEHVLIEIEDDGPGVPAGLAGQIFEPFFSTKEVGEGTGLGLSIGLGIAQAHGGSLTLAPSTSGACFRLTLPGAKAGQMAHAEPLVSGATWTTVVGRRALVADDEPPLRQLLQRLLFKRGFAVDVAADGQAAAALLDQHRYDAIFCDVLMPKMGGLAVYDRLRRRQPHLLKTFVFVTGDILSAQLQPFIDSTQTPVLSKPFGAAKLDAVLDQLFAYRAPMHSVS
ncbi:MAG TPA: ATP-binding protein, partial [Vicinamibacterales bacterium]|nr:ATP-binding protein [Vicinamibacterales bacterium]